MDAKNVETIALAGELLVRADAALAEPSLTSNVEPQALSKFMPGDVVCWTNDYGVKWHGRRILGLDPRWASWTRPEPRSFIEPHDAPWCSIPESALSLETLGVSELQAAFSCDGGLRRHAEREPSYLLDICHDERASKIGTI